MNNLLLEPVQYKIEKTSLGTWKRYLYASGARSEEFRSHASLFGLPLLHFTLGVCPETGKRRVAKGVIAVGRLAMGILAIGQASLGVLALGQLGVGFLALGQAGFGIVSVGQLAVAAYLALGQIAMGYIAIGQFGCGYTVLALAGYGEHVWSPKRADPVAVEFFRALLRRLFP